jgi:hypothetical protein
MRSAANNLSRFFDSPRHRRRMEGQTYPENQPMRVIRSACRPCFCRPLKRKTSQRERLSSTANALRTPRSDSVWRRCCGHTTSPRANSTISSHLTRHSMLETAQNPMMSACRHMSATRPSIKLPCPKRPSRPLRGQSRKAPARELGRTSCASRSARGAWASFTLPSRRCRSGAGSPSRLSSRAWIPSARGSV